jgi:hypothetical protein
MQTSQEEYQSLRLNPGFQLFKKYMEKLKEEIKKEWSEGRYTAESAEGTVQLNAKQIGKVEMLNHLLDDDEISYETIVEFISE